MFDLKDLQAISSDKQPDSITVIRLQTSLWHDKRGCYIRKSLTYLKRKCVGYNILEEDCGAVGAEILENIENLYDCEDGVYEVVMTNISHDFESGYVDDYDYRLVKWDK